MNAPGFCPHCGSDLQLDKPIMINDFSMFGDGYPLCHQNKSIKLTPGQSALVWSLLKAFPRTVSGDALMIRLGSDSESNVVDVLVSRVRAALRERGIPNHIETVRGRGYRWALTPQPYQSHGGGRPPKNACTGHRR